MENATKALIIAAAILIAIVLISLGVFVLGQGNTMVQENSDLSDVEVSTFNSKFEPYLGGNVSGTKVKQLVNAVKQNNLNNTDDSRKITLTTGVATGATAGVTAPILGTDNTKYDATKILTGNSYEVKANPVGGYTSKGLIHKIIINAR